MFCLIAVADLSSTRAQGFSVVVLDLWNGLPEEVEGDFREIVRKFCKACLFASAFEGSKEQVPFKEGRRRDLGFAILLWL